MPPICPFSITQFEERAKCYNLVVFIIGLTGNIATGKSTVTRILRELGAEVLDSDSLVRKAYEPDSETAKRVSHAFGPHVMRSDGGIDREALANVVFSNPDNMRRLETIVWPEVARLREEWLSQCAAGVVVVDAVKLIESGYSSRCDSVWVVTARPEVQRERLLSRPGMTLEQAQSRLDAQPEVAPRLAAAHVVIDNSGTLDELRARVMAAWNDTVPEQPQHEHRAEREER